MKLWVRRVFLLVLALALVGIIVYAFQPKPVGVDLAPVARGPLRITVDEDGETRIKERYEISSPLAGRMARVTLKAGAPVEAERTLLTVIDPLDPALLDARARAEAQKRVEEAEAALKQAQTATEAARVRLTYARAEMARLRAATTGVSLQELENAQARERLATEELRSTEQGVKVAEARVGLAKAALDWLRPRSPGEAELGRMELRSPITGQVLRVFQESATVVTPGQKVLEVGDPTDLECWIDVLSADAVKILPGAKVSLEHWGGERPLEGRVRLVQPSGFKKISALGVEEQRVWVIVDLVDPPAERRTLGDAFRVEARIVIWEAADEVKVPSSALFRQGDGWAVFVAAGEQAELRRIEVGRNNGLEAQVLSGLTEGEQVIVHPSDKVQAGVTIAPR